MTKLRRTLIWLYMSNKRLYKRPSFLVLLVAIIGITVIFNTSSQQSNYVLNVAIYSSDQNTTDFLKENTKQDSLISYTYFDSEQEAINAVSNKGLDTAWIFNTDLDTATAEFIENGSPIVRVIQREDTVFLKMLREKLFAVIYPKLSRALYSDYIQNTYNESDSDYVMDLYEQEVAFDEIIEIKHNDDSINADDLNHLTTPIRGLLSIAMFLCAYAALINFKKDKSEGRFGRIPMNRLIYVEIASILVAVLNAAVAILIALKFCGLFTVWHIEIGYMLLYAFVCVAFCVVFGEFIENIAALSAIMPIISIAMIVLCPIFVNTQSMQILQLLLPAYYYLTAFRNTLFVLYGFTYLIAATVLYAGTKHIKKHIR